MPAATARRPCSHARRGARRSPRLARYRSESPCGRRRPRPLSRRARQGRRPRTPSGADRGPHGGLEDSRLPAGLRAAFPAPPSGRGRHGPRRGADRHPVWVPGAGFPGRPLDLGRELLSQNGRRAPALLGQLGVLGPRAAARPEQGHHRSTLIASAHPASVPTARDAQPAFGQATGCAVSLGCSEGWLVGSAGVASWYSAGGGVGATAGAGAAAVVSAAIEPLWSSSPVTADLKSRMPLPRARPASGSRLDRAPGEPPPKRTEGASVGGCRRS